MTPEHVAPQVVEAIAESLDVLGVMVPDELCGHIVVIDAVVLLPLFRMPAVGQLNLRDPSQSAGLLEVLVQPFESPHEVHENPPLEIYDVMALDLP